jgi:Domain of unknown function (DUF4234)
MTEQQYPAQPGSQLQYFVAERANTDFITEPGMAILLSIITCGIYGLYIIYKLVQRRDEHLRRMAGVVDASMAQLRVKAQGREDLIAPELSQLEQIRLKMATMSAERGAAIWLLICLLTGIGYFILYYLLMKDYVEHDVTEAQFFTLMSSALAKLGLAGQAAQAMPSVPQRSYGTFLVLSIITCGIYGIYWMYVMIKDFNDHFMAQVPWEDFLLQSLA